MISNTPKASAIEKQGIECLYQAFDAMYKNDQDAFEFVSHYKEYKENIRLKYWKYHQGLLRTCLVLLFQSIENFFKAEICKTSPLLLLDEVPKNWNSVNQSKDFNDFHIRSFEDLLPIYLDSTTRVLTSSQIQEFDLIRRKRNKILHGLFKENLTVEYLLDIFYLICITLIGPNMWWKKIRHYLIKEPLFGIYDSDIEKALLSYRIEYLWDNLGISKMSKLFDMNLKARRYTCPYCNHYLKEHYDEDESRYAFLKPNEPESTAVYCIVCDREYKVIRKDCKESDCKGNVLSAEDEVCLSCSL